MTHRLRQVLVTCAVALSCFGCPGDRAEPAHEEVAPGPLLPKPASDPWLLHAHSVGGELPKLPKIAVDEQGNLASEDPTTQVRSVFAALSARELELLKAALARAPQQVESHCEAPVDGVDLMLSFQRDGQWFAWECPRPENELTSVWSAVLRPHLAELPGAPVHGHSTAAVPGVPSEAELEIERPSDTWPVGSVTLAGPKRVGGTGKLGSPTLMRAVRAQLRAIQICYEQAVRTQPELRGSGRVTVHIDADGKVSAGEIRAATADDKLPARCVSDALRRVHMISPGPVGGDVDFELRLLFSWRMQSAASQGP